MAEFEPISADFGDPKVLTPQKLALTVAETDGQLTVVFCLASIGQEDGKLRPSFQQLYKPIAVPNADPQSLLRAIEQFETEYINQLAQLRTGVHQDYDAPLNTIRQQLKKIAGE